MLLRTFVLFLCVSSSLCATLSLFHMKDEETPAQDPAPGLDVVVEAVDGNMEEKNEVIAAEISNNTAPPTEEKSLPENLMENDEQQEVKKEVEEVQAATEDVAATEEVVTESDNKAEEIVETNVTQDQLPQQEKEEEDNDIKPVQIEEVPKKPEEQSSRWSLNSIRSSFQNMNGYFDSLVELVGGRNGVCQYRCRYGEIPAPRPGYQIPEPNGCSSSLVGFQVNSALDLGIPAMTQCCNQLDSCYDTCGTSKYDCDSNFRFCLHGICSDLKKSLGLGTQYQTCESMADGLFNTVWTLGCRPYMNSQRAACICEEEEKDEL